MQITKNRKNRFVKLVLNLLFIFCFIFSTPLVKSDDSQLVSDYTNDETFVYTLQLNKNFDSLNHYSMSPNGKYIGIDFGQPKWLALFEQNGTILWQTDARNLTIVQGGVHLTSDKISLSNNGNMLILNSDTSELTSRNQNIDYITLIDKNGNILWSKEMDSVVLKQGAISMSSNGNYISYISGNSNVYLLNNKGEIIWFEDTNKYNHNAAWGKNMLTISNNGDILISSSYDGDKYTDVKFINKNGTLVFKKEVVLERYSSLMSNDGEYILMYKILFDNKGNVINDLNLKITAGGYPSILTSNKELLWINLDGNVLLYDYNGNIIKKYEMATDKNLIVKNLRYITKDASILVFNIQNKLYAYVLTIDVEYPVDENINTGLPTFSWKGLEDNDYQISVDGAVINVTGNKYTPNDHLQTGNHEWKVRKVLKDGTYGYWSENSSFIVTKQDKVIEEKSQENPFNVFSIAAASFVIILISIYLIRPSYKRAKVRRKMVLTSTDWCPHCNKFTGGANICPHCGKDTLIEIDTKNISEKIRSKKK